MEDAAAVTEQLLSSLSLALQESVLLSALSLLQCASASSLHGCLVSNALPRERPTSFPTEARHASAAVVLDQAASRAKGGSTRSTGCRGVVPR